MISLYIVPYTQSFVMPSVQVSISKSAVYILTVILMICAGTLNTLSAKHTNLMKAKGTNPKDEHYFDHPFFQTGLMFFGEMLCLFAFQALNTIQKLTGRCIYSNNEDFLENNITPLVWILPASCDLIGTTMLFIGLSWTFASSFQMLRGSVVIFTGVFSVIFLKAKLHLHHCFGILLVMSGLMLVGIGDYNYYDKEEPYKKNYILASDLLIVISQIVAAFQNVIEEYLLKKYRTPPLQAVGWEGLLGFAMVCSIYIPIYMIPWHPPSPNVQATPRFEDITDAIAMLGYNCRILLWTFVFIISVGVFNVTALTVTRTMNATTRVVLDSIRTAMVWGISILIPLQTSTEPFQPAGYCVLLLGTCIYHNIISILLKRCKKYFGTDELPSERKPIINQSTPGGISDEQSSHEHSERDEGQQPQDDGDMTFHYEHARYSNM